MLLAAFPDRLGRRREAGGRRLALVGGRGAILDEASAVREAELVLAVVVGAPAAGSGEVRVRVAAAVDPADLQTTEAVETEFDPSRQAVVQARVVRAAGLELARYPAAGDADPLAAASVLATAVRADPRRALRWDADVDGIITRLRFLAEHLPEQGLPTFSCLEPGGPAADDDAIAILCTGRRSFAELRRLPLAETLLGLLRHDQRRLLEREAPERWPLPAGGRARLRYEPGQPPILSARVQQLFGVTQTPRVALGRVPVLVELLAPSMRPVQLTADLAGFWAGSYADVRKQLRGRYPKHPWPEVPTAKDARR